jgi:two-component system cell cycle sensor histidine kinase/response regulator CckA
LEELRRKAEAWVASRPAPPKQLSPEEVQAGLAKLHLAQVEMAMQNEQLCRTQADLEAALRRYVDFYDCAPVAYLTLDERSQILEANLTAATMLGVARCDLLQRPVTHYIVREDRSVYFRHCQKLFETQEPQHYELRMVRKDGGLFWAGIATIGPDSSKAQLYRATISDITERKQMEEELRTSEEKYRLVSEYNNNWEYWVSPDNTLIYNSPSCRRITGYAPEEFIADPTLFAAIVHPEDRKMMASHYREITQASMGTCELEFRIVHKDGEERWLSHVCRPVYRDQGIWMGRRASSQDITARKQAEEAFQVLVNRAPMGIFIVQDGKFKMANPGFEKTAGYTAQELLGQESLSLVSPDYQEMVRQNAVQMLKGELDLPYEFPIITKSGETRWVMEKVTTTLFQGKRATLGYFLDISEHKNLQDQFFQAQKMEAVGRLAGGVAHDFNNMLNVIFGNTDLMDQELSRQDPLARYLEEIRKASDRAATLTRQLLSFSRKTILAPQIINLNDQLVEIQEMLSRLIGEDIEIVLVLEPALGPVQADPNQIEQVVMNLVVNSRDAMPRGGKLTLKTANISLHKASVLRNLDLAPGKYVMLEVTDSGQGMDGATIARIFEPFFTTKELGRGTGLGLSTVYGIIKQSGGSIAVHSGVGQGTAFKVYLPRAQAAITANSEVKPRARDLQGSETILVVEDEDMLRNLISRGLKLHGYTVLEARHGAEAISLCKQHSGPIHLLLTDLLMPKIGGYDLADRLRPLRPDMKVVFMSGFAENDNGHHEILETDIHFIQKPFRMTALMEKIQERLEENARQP